MGGNHEKTDNYMDCARSYNGGLGDSTKGLIKQLMVLDPTHDETWHKNHYQIKGTVKDSNIPVYGKLAANSFKVQKFNDVKNKWEDATNITFSKWNSQDNGGGVDYDSAGTFMPSWLETLVYGDRYTLYAQWNIKP